MSKYPITPAGEIIYSHLIRPSTKFDTDGVYDLTLAIDDTEAQPLIELIDQAIEDNKTEITKKLKKGAKIKENDLPYTAELDTEGCETGRTLFKFKQKASHTTKEGQTYNFKIAIYDASLKPTAPTSIGRGTKCKAAFEPNPYYTGALGAGVSLRLKAIQILSLETYADTGEAIGFTAEQGYTDDTTASDTDDTDLSNTATAESDSDTDF